MDALLGLSFTALLAGVFLLTLGLRGRKLDDHPVCRKCTFDLVGTWPGRETCPECGADLTRESAIRFGHIARDRKLLWFGGVIIALAVILGGTAAYLNTRGISLVPYYPDWWLVRQAIGAPADPFELLDEIERRTAAGRLSTETRMRLVVAALQKQGDLSYGWYGAWGSLLQLERGRGMVSDEQFKRYLTQCVRLSYSVELDSHRDYQLGGMAAVVVKLNLDSRASQLPRMPGLRIGVSSLRCDGEDRLVRQDARTGLATTRFDRPSMHLLSGRGGSGGVVQVHEMNWDPRRWPARAEATVELTIWYSAGGDGPEADDAFKVEWTEVVPVKLPDRPR